MCTIYYRDIAFTQADYDALCGIVKMLESRVADNERMVIRFGESELPVKPKVYTYTELNCLTRSEFVQAFPSVERLHRTIGFINAIKELREITGLSLKEAKDLVESKLGRG